MSRDSGRRIDDILNAIDRCQQYVRRLDDDADDLVLMAEDAIERNLPSPAKLHAARRRATAVLQVPGPPSTMRAPRVSADDVVLFGLDRGVEFAVAWADSSDCVPSALIGMDTHDGSIAAAPLAEELRAAGIECEAWGTPMRSDTIPRLEGSAKGSIGLLVVPVC